MSYFPHQTMLDLAMPMEEIAASVVVTNAEKIYRQVSDSKCNHRQPSLLKNHDQCGIYL